MNTQVLAFAIFLSILGLFCCILGVIVLIKKDLNFLSVINRSFNDGTEESLKLINSFAVILFVLGFVSITCAVLAFFLPIEIVHKIFPFSLGVIAMGSILYLVFKIKIK